MSARTIVVRGDLSADRAGEVLRLWSATGFAVGDDALRLLPDVVALVVDDDRVVGASTAVAHDIGLLGDRRLWAYQEAHADGARDTDRASLFNTTFEVLATDHVPGDAGPIGVCTVVRDVELRQRRPEAVWHDSGLFHAGWTYEGHPLRARYFDGALCTEGLPDRRLDLPPLDRWREVFPLADGYVVEEIETSSVSRDDIVALWKREDAVPSDELAIRIDEVRLVATHHDEPVGVMTGYVRRSGQLGVDTWHERAFVARDHRRTNLAMHLAVLGVELLERRFVEGVDRSAGGVVIDVQHPGLRGAFPQAVWPYTVTHFIGEQPNGSTVYVRWFPGATIPPTM
jgi:hypothetical protein